MAEVANIARLGLRGVKFHPSLQAFDPADPQFWPVFAACAEHGLPLTTFMLVRAHFP